MESETQSILSWFHRQDFATGVLNYDELLFNAVKEALNKSDIDAESYLQQNCKRHWNALLKNIDLDSQLGRKPIFSVTDVSSRRLAWIPNALSTLATNSDRLVAIRLQSKPAIIRAIDGMTDRQYEALGCVSCQLIGATHTLLTPRGNEGGIDFFARLIMPSRCHVFAGMHNPLRIIGQSKKYTHRVQVDKVKEFIQTIDEIKNQNPSVEHLVPAWFRAASGPIIGWLISHKGVQSGGVTKARNHGIAVSDSLDIAEIAALSRAIDVSLPTTTRASVLYDNVVEFCRNT